MKFDITKEELEGIPPEYEQVDKPINISASELPKIETPIPPRTTGQQVIDVAGKFVQGVGDAVYGTLGMPVDVISSGMRALGAPMPEAPIGGSNWIKQWLGAGGMYGYDAPNTPVNRLAQTTGQFLPSVAAAPFMPGQAGNALSAVGKSLLPTAGAIVGTQTARELAPGNPYAELAGGLAGGMSATAVQNLATKTSSLPSLVSKHLNRAAPVNKFEFTPKAQQSAATAVEDMVLVNRNLPQGFKYTDATGKVTRTGLPQTVEEMAQALPQAKASIYKQYNTMQRNAGQKELMFNGNEIIDDLNAWANRADLPPSAELAKPYLENRMRLYEGKLLTPQQIESEIATLNARLKAHFKNPNPNDVSSAMVDAEVARILNSKLDEAITRIEGPGYGQLREQYGNLKSIEDRVNRGATAQINRLAKDPSQWLPKGWDAGWVLEMIGAVQVGHPSAALAGVAAIGGPRIRKWLIDPDRNVRVMFEKADKMVKPREKWSMGERTFATNEQPQLARGYSAEGEIIPPQVQLPPRQTAGLLESPKAPGTVQAPWNPVNKPGGVAERVLTQGTTRQDAAKFDYESALDSLIQGGVSPSEANDMLRNQIINELRRRGVNP